MAVVSQLVELGEEGEEELQQIQTKDQITVRVFRHQV